MLLYCDFTGFLRNCSHLSDATTNACHTLFNFTPAAIWPHRASLMQILSLRTAHTNALWPTESAILRDLRRGIRMSWGREEGRGVSATYAQETAASCAHWFILAVECIFHRAHFRLVYDCEFVTDTLWLCVEGTFRFSISKFNTFENPNKRKRNSLVLSLFSFCGLCFATLYSLRLTLSQAEIEYSAQTQRASEEMYNTINCA